MSIASSDPLFVGGDAIDGPPRALIADMPLQTLGSSSRRAKQQAPQDAIDEFWRRFTTKTPGKATQIIPQNAYAERVAKKAAKAVGTTTQASFEEAAALCKAKVEKIVIECKRINQKYRDPHFDLEFDLKLGRRDCLESLSNVKNAPDPQPLLPPFSPKSVKRVVDIFDQPQFYVDGPTANDVRQGRDGDCWLMAALCTLSNKPGLIERVCVAHDPAVGVYGFIFHRDGEWFSEIIDDKLYLTKPDYDEGFLERILWEDRERVNSEEAYRKIYQTNSGALYFAQCENPNETWLPLLEKAYAKAHGDYAAIEGGFTGEGIEDLTGGVTSEIYTTDILDKEYFWKEELLRVNQDFLFGCSTGWFGRGWGERRGIIESHAYSVMRAVELDGKRLLLLKNPWGKGEWKGAWSDGSKEWTPEWLQKLNHRFGDDGAFWISYEDLLRKYQAFDRTRLFGPEWKITSIWTTLTVPWTLDYHDTRFAFTLAKSGPVVIVLSQLDDRYFRGLEGQYRFDLAFRLHEAGKEEYVVRSAPGYRQNRSVNVELYLKAGQYTVWVKIDAMRNDQILTVDQVIKNNAKDRREKLIRIGLAYDLAHSKGKIIETPEERKRREAHEKRKKEKEREEFRKNLQEERERTYYLKVKRLKKQQKRVAKMNAKRKAQAEKQRRNQGLGLTFSGHNVGLQNGKQAENIKKAVSAKVEEGNKPASNGTEKHVKIWVPVSEENATDPSKEDSSPEQDEETRLAVISDMSSGSTEPTKGAEPSDSAGSNGLATPKMEEKQEPENGYSPKSKPVDRDSNRMTTNGVVKEAKTEGTAAAEESEDARSDASNVRTRSDLSFGESNDSELESISSLSDLSDRELDIQMEARRSGIGRRTAPFQPSDDLDEFERDPWNAVAVVGLRIYYKVAEEDKPNEIVKLRVVRPYLLDDDDDEELGEKGDGAELKTKGLDVDDSAKDATLEGDPAARKKSIVDVE